jgi:uncharacterized protein (UPF0210 family)
MRTFGISSIGQSGSAVAASFLAHCLDRAQFQRIGFCGLFFPVLEDFILAKDAAGGSLTLKDLLLYATICGTGLDTVPLPGDVSQEALYAILLDVGALALRHDKPLTARLMPIPGKQAGDPVQFDFEYFADSRILKVDSDSLNGILSSGGSIVIRPRSIPGRPGKTNV